MRKELTLPNPTAMWQEMQNIRADVAEFLDKQEDSEIREILWTCMNREQMLEWILAVDMAVLRRVHEENGLDEKE